MITEKERTRKNIEGLHKAIRFCSEAILEHLNNIESTNIHKIQKVLSESFSSNIINTSIDKLKQEGMIFEPRRNEIRRVN